jgi:hypothetical protein
MRSSLHVGHAGDVAPVCFSLTYAAPEVARAFTKGEGVVSADAACDVFALGVCL